MDLTQLVALGREDPGSLGRLPGGSSSSTPGGPCLSPGRWLWPWPRSWHGHSFPRQDAGVFCKMPAHGEHFATEAAAPRAGDRDLGVTVLGWWHLSRARAVSGMLLLSRPWPAVFPQLTRSRYHILLPAVGTGSSLAPCEPPSPGFWGSPRRVPAPRPLPQGGTHLADGVEGSHVLDPAVRQPVGDFGAVQQPLAPSEVTVFAQHPAAGDGMGQEGMGQDGESAVTPGWADGTHQPGQGRAGLGLTYIPPLTRTDSTWLLKPSAWRLRTSLFSSISFPSKHSSPCRKMEGSEKNCGMGEEMRRERGKREERAPMGAEGLQGWRAGARGTRGRGKRRFLGGFCPSAGGTHHWDLLQGADGGGGEAAHGTERGVLALGQHMLLPREGLPVEQDPAGGEERARADVAIVVGIHPSCSPPAPPCPAHPPREPPRVPAGLLARMMSLFPSPAGGGEAPGHPTCPRRLCRSVG